MKLTNLFMTGLVAVSVIAASCSSDNTEAQVQSESGDAVMRISLKSENVDSSRASGALPDESAIKNFTVFVFNAENDALETSVKVTNSNTAIVSGLSTGFPKHVIVVANTPQTFPVFNEGDNISKLQQASAAINLTQQSPAAIATNGMVMVGETSSPVTLSLTGTTSVDVNIKRLAARVRLGTIDVRPIGDYNLDLFEVTGVSIQRAIASTDIYGNPIDATSLYGGVVGSYNAPVQSFLYDGISGVNLEVAVPYTFDNYFYVLPFESEADCTLLTLHSTYDGDEQYFPIKINAEQGNKNTDGTYIQSNHSYVINIVVNNLGEGTTDPDVPPTTASIEVNITPELWELDIVQDVIW